MVMFIFVKLVGGLSFFWFVVLIFMYVNILFLLKDSFWLFVFEIFVFDLLINV